jgi:hypothetical protein
MNKLKELDDEDDNPNNRELKDIVMEAYKEVHKGKKRGRALEDETELSPYALNQIINSLPIRKLKGILSSSLFTLVANMFF